MFVVETEEGRLNIEPMLTHRVGWQEMPDIYDRLVKATWMSSNGAPDGHRPHNIGCRFQDESHF